jgi:hypothetical protein
MKCPRLRKEARVFNGPPRSAGHISSRFALFGHKKSHAELRVAEYLEPKNSGL